MGCNAPLRAFRRPGGGPLSFSPVAGFGDRPLRIPCGQCAGCRLERSRVWAMRCVQEASLYDDNCFITLTYSDEALPEDGSLRKADLQGFFKRLRDRVGYGRVRYYACGEYGDSTARPHYHALIFNYDFADKAFFTQSRSGAKLYTSSLLDDLWGFGHCQIGSVSFESAAYVARYIMKKITGDLAADYYAGREPEFNEMSRRPGIGRGWIDKFLSDVYPRDYAVVNGVKCRPPRFYDGVYEVVDAKLLARVKGRRVRRARRFEHENTTARLDVKETLARFRVSRFSRDGG